MFHFNVIGATAGEAPFVLDRLVGNAALFHLLGLAFAPRPRDFPDRRLACFGRPGRWKQLAPLMGKPINEEVVLEHWNDALRLTASIKTASVKPSAMLRKLGAYRQQNRLYLALGLGTAPTRSSGESTQTVAVSGLERPGVRRRTS